MSDFAQKELSPNMRQWDEEVWPHTEGAGLRLTPPTSSVLQEVFPVHALRAAAQLGLGGALDLSC